MIIPCLPDSVIQAGVAHFIVPFAIQLFFSRSDRSAFAV
jgi:hypothetical protein